MNESIKWECVARWLNKLYDNFREKKITDVWACETCPYFSKECNEVVAPPENFEIIEQFTGEGTIIGSNSNYRTFL